MTAPDVRAVVHAALSTVQGTLHHLGLVTLEVLTDRVTDAVTPLVGRRTETLAEAVELLTHRAHEATVAEPAGHVAGLREAIELLTLMAGRTPDATQGRPPAVAPALDAVQAYAVIADRLMAESRALRDRAIYSDGIRYAARKVTEWGQEADGGEAL